MPRTIEEIRSMNDPQRSYHWEIFLPNLGTPKPETGTNEGSLKSNFRRLEGLAREEVNQRASSILGAPLEVFTRPTPNFHPNFQVEEVQGIPFPSVEREAFYEAGRNTYFPSIEDIASFSVVFYHDASGNLPEYIQNWKSKIVNLDGTKNLPGYYKYPINIKLLNGLKQEVLNISLKGCFPTQTSGYNLNQQSENLKLTQEFSVDRVFMEPIKTSDADPKQQIEDRLKQKTRQRVNRESGFNLLDL